MNILPRSVSNGVAASYDYFGSLATPTRIRALRHGLILCGVLAALFIAWRAYQATPGDAFVYWSHRPPVSYTTGPGTNAFLYSPAFAQAISPVTSLPWHAFVVLWLGGMLLALAWMTGPLLLLPVVFLASSEIHYGNVNFFIAAAMVAGFRHPAAWSVPLLTKVTPGIGLLWFAVRREWRALGIALGATAAIVTISFAIDPGGWLGWLRMLATAPDVGHPAVVPGPIWLRVALAAALVILGARSNRRWTIPVAAVICLPHSTLGLNMLVAVIPLSGIAALRPSWRTALA